MTPNGMTAAQFMEQFPGADGDGNENCLKDMACPACGSRGPFRIAAGVVVRVFDDGTDTCSDFEWSNSSRCVCDDCEHAGTVGAFTFEGLDELLAKRISKGG